MDLFSIPYDHLSQFNTIFRDYCKKEKVSDFYSHHFQDILTGKLTFNPFSKKIHHRSELSEAVLKTNLKYEHSEKTLQNIHLLKSDTTFAVVTGQQTGLYSGPLYTIYKTIGVIKTAENLKRKYPEYDFVPVFWLEQEDSDFKEINHVKLISKNSEIVNIRYDESFNNELKDPVYRLMLSEEITETNERIFNELTATDFSKPLSECLADYYKPGQSLSEAFAGWMAHLFGHYGLILFNPSERFAKYLLKDIFRQAVANAEEIHDLVIARSKQLIESGHFAQVETNPSYLYCSDPGEIKNKLNGKHFNKFRIRTPLADEEKKDILSLIDSQPERFAPNVLLRPIVQDYLLPTIAYIAGPGEVAYFAQTEPLYRYFNIIQPFIIPRPSATIIEKKISMILEKHHLNIADVFERSENMVNELIIRQSDSKILEQLQKKWLVIGEELNHLREPLLSTDASLAGVLDTTIKKMSDVYTVLQKKTIDSEKRKNSDLILQTNKMLVHIFPEKNFQERQLNVVYYLNKYDFSFIDWLYEHLEMDTAYHQILHL